MVGVATQVKGQVLGQAGNSCEVAGLASSGELLQCSVGTVDVISVVLAVVQLHNLAGDVRLQSVVSVIQLRKFVLSH